MEVNSGFSLNGGKDKEVVCWTSSQTHGLALFQIRTWVRSVNYLPDLCDLHTVDEVFICFSAPHNTQKNLVPFSMRNRILLTRYEATSRQFLGELPGFSLLKQVQVEQEILINMCANWNL